MKRITEAYGPVWVNDQGQEVFSIRETVSDGRLTLCPQGNISSGFAAAFEDELMAGATVCDRITVDLSGVGSISSGGLKAFLLTQKLLDKRPDAGLTLRAITPAVYATLVDMGFDELFEIEREEGTSC